MSSNNRNRVTKKSQSQLKWFNNVAKSLGYASADLITDMVPASSQFVKSNYEATTELVQDMRQNRTSGKRLSDQIANLEQVKILNTGLKNALDDIKSGNIYNKERELAYIDQALDDEGLNVFGNDFGDDFSFGGEFDDAIDDFESIETDDSDPNVTNVKKVNVKNVNNNIGRSVNMLPLAKAMNNQTEVLSTAIHNSANVQAAVSTEFMMLYNTNASTMSSGLTSINDNLSLLVNFQNDSMAKYIGASLKYYEDHLNKIDESFTLLKDGFAGRLSEDTRKKKGSNDDISVLLSEGGLDIKEYIKSVKRNIKREAESNNFISTASMIWSDTDALREIANNPLKSAITGMLKSVIPNSLKNRLSDTDASFAEFFPALINRVGGLKDSSNPFLQMAGKILVPERRIKKETDIDLSNYNKGVVGFDGESKKALVEVIPTYLRKIESLMSGQEEKIYDYESGKFKSASKLKSDLSEELLKVKTSGYTTFKSEFKNIMNSFDIGSEKEKEEFYKELDRYLVKMTERGKAINPVTYFMGEEKIDELTENGLFLDSDMRETFSKIYKQLPKKIQSELLGSGINNSINRLNRFTDDIENNPHKYGFSSISNNSNPNELFTNKNGKLVMKKGVGLSGNVDKYGLSQLDYLRDIKYILSKGIVTYPNTSGGGTIGGTVSNPHEQFISEYSNEPTTGTKIARKNLIKNKAKSDAYKVDGIAGLAELSDEQISAIINKGKKEEPRGFKSSGAYKFLNRYEKLHGVRDAAEKLFDKPIRMMEDVTKVAENTMYTILHGLDEGYELSELSDTLKTKLFGDMANNKEATFKFDTQLPGNIAQFFSDNKMQLKIGGGLGLLGSFFLPGGPIGGALLGMGAGIATKSDWFQKFIYGDDFKTEKSWKSGFFGKALNKFGGKLDEWGIDPKYASYLSAGGAGLGLLSSFFLPFGPVGGALLGLSGGIAASSNKFQKWLFGEKGEDDVRRGGFLSKFTNWFDANVKESLMIKVSEIGMNVADFFHNSISEPFLEAMGPLKHLFNDVADKTKEMFHRGWEAINENVFTVFRDNVAKPFGETLEKFVLDPLKGFMSKTLSFAGKLIGGVVSAPFKALGFVSDKVDKKYEKEGLAEEKKQRWDRDVQEVKQKFMKGELTWKDAKNFIKNRGDLKGEDRDRFLNELLPYRNLARDAKIEREKRHAEKQAKRQEAINKRKGIQSDKIQMGRDTDYKYITEEKAVE